MNKDRNKAIVIIVCVLLIIVGELVKSQLVYGDWTCAIAHCVKVSK